MKTIKVRVYSAFNHYLEEDKRNKWFPVEINDDASLETVIESLGIPHSDVGMTLVNEKFFIGGLLNDGDCLEILPCIVGG